MKEKVWFIYLLVLILAGCTYAPLPKQNGNEGTEKKLTNEETKESDKIFLLIGVDTRGEQKSRSDAIILAKYFPEQEKLKLASIMRDSYVKIPGNKSGYDKINAAYYYGGRELLKKTIQENFDVKVDHVAVIDFQGFVKMVDLLAPEGVAVNVDQEIIDDMSIQASVGKNVLHGEEILKYVRFRHDDESDFGRVERQQEVMVQLKTAFINQISSFEGMAALPSIIEQGLSYLDTDIGLKTIMEMGPKAVFHTPDTVETLRVPVEGSFKDETYPQSGAVLEMDCTENKKALQEFFSK
ncbi:LCP family protein [Peribacillus castrilensis]|uniref:Regulatory protein MsrR n=1 Tax=Peribacillus simplex TaxID=1478 RepID=A0AAN2PJC2_9BACI|nr:MULTISPECIES: LCP family protein [Bacillaceae]MCP1094006.1 LCP family protein [Bacillaceae bacterium OS4b]MBD8589770.1 LCP family protein [Peribacillus simplex]MCF7623064.1 LCP family protein [Peribacillus frigoritolerans]MEA3574356.1 LCP family protein [Peribacillus frigoritolerans]NCT37866.1 LCP family protein [Peribacillus frigoritolerans]